MNNIRGGGILGPETRKSGLRKVFRKKLEMDVTVFVDAK